ncbi:MAG: SIMPL domain-containing protein [Candidatus Sericytochromatia bacterium]|nr:SIMPL domain-containing protein [Candidatus Sericytochromatia bacterium]
MSKTLVGALIALHLSSYGAALPVMAAELPKGPETANPDARFAVPPRTIRVVGDGSVRVAPDLATVSLGIEATAKQAVQAQAAAGSKTQAVITRLQAMGIAKADIQTSGLQLSPEYAQNPKPDQTIEERLVGYRATLQLQVRCKPEQAGPVVDTAVGAGVNRMEGIQFSRKAIDKPRQDAIDMAMAQAMAQIRATLSPLGLTLKEVRQIDVSDSSGMPSPRQMMDNYGGGATAKMSTPVAPGELEIRANVTVIATF